MNNQRDISSACDDRSAVVLPALRDRVVRDVVRAWRELTRGVAQSGREDAKLVDTLVACSGGADSTALLLALRAATRRLVVGHVVHDLRPAEECEAERDRVRELADALGLPFLEARVIARRAEGEGGGTHGPRNLEARARRLRYAALAEMARASGAAFVATAHHADDQLETLVMALLRGAGPQGLRGIAPCRRLEGGPQEDLTAHKPGSSGGVWLIRPMLSVRRAEAEELCRRCGVQWNEDPSNHDSSRLRAALRHGPLRKLAELRPEGARRAGRTAELMREAAMLVQERVERVFGPCGETSECSGSASMGDEAGDPRAGRTHGSRRTSWGRDALRSESELVIAAGLRRHVLRLTGGEGADRFSSHLIKPVIRAIKDASTETRRFAWPFGVHVEVTSRLVTIQA